MIVLILIFAVKVQKKQGQCQKILHIAFTNRSKIGVFNIGTVIAF
jgi:hypothetical protein